MGLEKDNNPWYVVDGIALTVEEMKALKDSRAWRGIARGIEGNIAMNDGMRDQYDIEHGRERHLAGQVRTCKWVLQLPQQLIGELLLTERQEIINARRDRERDDDTD